MLVQIDYLTRCTLKVAIGWICDHSRRLMTWHCIISYQSLLGVPEYSSLQIFRAAMETFPCMLTESVASCVVLSSVNRDLCRTWSFWYCRSRCSLTEGMRCAEFDCRHAAVPAASTSIHFRQERGARTLQSLRRQGALDILLFFRSFNCSDVHACI
jgi:hypothetical protein